MPRYPLFIRQLYRSIKGRVQQRVVALTIPTWQGGIRPEYFDRTFENYVKEGYKKNEVVYACITVTANTAASVALEVQDKQTDKKLPEHPLQQLISHPNPLINQQGFIAATLSCLMLAGVSYWQKVRSTSGDLLSLWPIRPDWIAPKVVEGEGLVGYSIKVNGIEIGVIDPRDMLVFKLYDPLDIFSKTSPIEVISRVVDVDNAITDYIKTFMQKGAMPPGILSSKLKLNDDAVSDIQHRWQERYGGSSNWFSPAVLDSDATYQKIGSSLDELKFQNIGAWTATRICMVYHIPPIIVGTEVGLSKGTYSNYDQSRRQWWEDTLGAQYKLLADAIQSQLADIDYDGDVKVEWDFSKVAALQEERNSRWARATAAATAGVITVNMALKEMGLPLVGAEGDVFLRAATVQAVPNNPADDRGGDDVGAVEDETAANENAPTEGNGFETKEFTSDAERRWFFANNPSFAADNSMPRLQEGADRETHRKQLESFAENHKNRVANHLWDSGMIKYDDHAQVVVNHDRVRNNAADLVKDARDATLSRDYLVSSFAQSEGRAGTKQQIEGQLNAHYADKARATLLATHVGGVKLTDAQQQRLQSMAQGNYLNDKYSQYRSGNNGTLIGVQKERLQGMSEDAQRQREEHRREFRTNIRKSTNQDAIETKAPASNAIDGIVGHKLPTPEALRVVPFSAEERNKIFDNYGHVKAKVG